MFEQLHSGELYDPNDPALMKEQLACLEKLYDFNATRPHELEKRTAMLREMFAELGENCYIEPPLCANWGGKFVHFGKGIYANFGLTLTDDTHIYVGDNTLFGPHVSVITAAHPIDAEQRRKGLQYNKPVRIGRNCWIGAGSVVTKDIPSGVVAVGNPCRVLRKAEDRE